MQLFRHQLTTIYLYVCNMTSLCFILNHKLISQNMR